LLWRLLCGIPSAGDTDTALSKQSKSEELEKVVAAQAELNMQEIQVSTFGFLQWHTPNRPNDHCLEW
jgi:hypothetical protein